MWYIRVLWPIYELLLWCCRFCFVAEKGGLVISWFAYISEWLILFIVSFFDAQKFAKTSKRGIQGFYHNVKAYYYRCLAIFKYGDAKKRLQQMAAGFMRKPQLLHLAAAHAHLRWPISTNGSCTDATPMSKASVGSVVQSDLAEALYDMSEMRGGHVSLRRED